MHRKQAVGHTSARIGTSVLWLSTAMATLLLGGCEWPFASSADEESKTSAQPSTLAVQAHAKAGAQAMAATPSALAVTDTPVSQPVLFVAQVPTEGDQFASRMSTFANHLPGMESVPRGGDLVIRYPDGSLRFLTREAGFGVEGLQNDKGIAVREPTVHWDGTKAIFSMLVGAAPKQYESPKAKWQLYEVTGLAQGQTAVITKVPNQPTQYNNVSPLYASDDRILFTSDRPYEGQAHLYPHLDEYESTPTITGLYSLEPQSGQLQPLNHTPSGAFSPSIDSYGRLVFIRWDHLQRDQQADGGNFGPRNYASEAVDAAKLPQQPETFPESRTGMDSAYGPVTGFTTNLFSPWQMNQDGTAELTMNHVGRQEMAYLGYLSKSFANDAALRESSNDPPLFANRKQIREDGGIFHLRESPTEAGTYYGIYTREFGTATTDQIIRFNGAPTLNAEQMVFSDATPANATGGRYRNPLPMSTGQFVAAYTPSPTFQTGVSLRLHRLRTRADGMLEPAEALTSGIVRQVSWWTPDVKKTYNGALWEMEAVEVVARTRPPLTAAHIDPIEKSVLAEEHVDEAQLRLWLKQRKLALIVVRDQTSRDRGDRQQPFNLSVPGGVKTTAGNGKVYDISHYQIFQGNQVRSYDNYNAGRRTLAQPLQGGANPPNAAGPAGSVVIAKDGSSAAFVPANRALTWQTTDANGTPIVRERVWVTMQAGEIRTCAGCHGENTSNQAGKPMSTQQAQALRDLLRYWKQQNGLPRRATGSQPAIPGQAI